MLIRMAALMLLLLAPAASGAQALKQVKPLTDAELAEMRGGFTLPGGISIALGVTSETRIDGRLVMRSVYRLADGAPELAVFGGDGEELQASALATADGNITIHQGGGARVRFSGEGIDVSHLIGNAFGSVLSNTASDRSIDVVTTVDMNVSGITPDLLGSAAMRVEGLALDATSRLSR